MNFKQFLTESAKASQDATKVERELKSQGISYSKDINTGYVAFELDDSPGVKIVVDGVSVKVVEYGSEEFYDEITPASITKAVKIAQEG